MLTATFSSELCRKYNVRSIPIRKVDEVQVDCNLRSIPTRNSASQALKYILSEEQCSLEGKCKHIQLQAKFR